MFPDQQHVQVLSAVWKQRRCKRGSIITQNALRLWAQVSVQHKHVSFSRWALRPWARSAGWINTSVMESVSLLQQCILGGRNQHLHLKAQSAVFSLIFKCDDHNLFQIWRKKIIEFIEHDLLNLWTSCVIHDTVHTGSILCQTKVWLNEDIGYWSVRSERHCASVRRCEEEPLCWLYQEIQLIWS